MCHEYVHSGGYYVIHKQGIFCQVLTPLYKTEGLPVLIMDSSWPYSAAADDDDDEILLERARQGALNARIHSEFAHAALEGRRRLHEKRTGVRHALEVEEDEEPVQEWPKHARLHIERAKSAMAAAGLQEKPALYPQLGPVADSDGLEQAMHLRETAKWHLHSAGAILENKKTVYPGWHPVSHSMEHEVAQLHATNDAELDLHLHGLP